MARGQRRTVCCKERPAGNLAKPLPHSGGQSIIDTNAAHDCDRADQVQRVRHVVYHRDFTPAHDSNARCLQET